MAGFDRRAFVCRFNRMRSISRARRWVTSRSVLMLAFVLLVTAGGSATAASLIDSGDVKNGSLKSEDIKDGTLQHSDIKDGTIDKDDIKMESITLNRLSENTQEQHRRQGAGGARRSRRSRRFRRTERCRRRVRLRGRNLQVPRTSALATSPRSPALPARSPLAVATGSTRRATTTSTSPTAPSRTAAPSSPRSLAAWILTASTTSRTPQMTTPSCRTTTLAGSCR